MFADRLCVCVSLCSFTAVYKGFDMNDMHQLYTCIVHRLRLRNYVKPNSRGEVKASENVLKMMKTEKGRYLDKKTCMIFVFPQFDR